MAKGSRVSGRSSRPRSRARSGRAAVVALGRPSLAMLLLIAGLLLASAFASIEIQRNALARQSSALLGDIAAAQATHGQLAADLATKKTDDYVMNKARDYGYVLPGEALIGVQQDAASPVAVVSGHAPTRVQKWIALFFGSR